MDMFPVLETLRVHLGANTEYRHSKSGGTKETGNGMLEAKSAYEREGLDFTKHAVAITMAGSEFDKYAATWIMRFQWDWVVAGAPANFQRRRITTSCTTRFRC